MITLKAIRLVVLWKTSASLYFYWYCLIKRAGFLHDLLLDQKVRTIDYAAAIQDIAVSGSPVQGIKTNSILNELQFFHICSPGLPLCLAHDLFERAIAKNLFIFIKHFVSEQKWFSYAYLNSNMVSFPYKYSDSYCKPPEVNEKGGELIGDAIATWNLLSFFFCVHRSQSAGRE